MANMKTTRRSTSEEGRRKKRKLVEANMAGPSLVDSLPSEMIVEILARVASASVADLSSCKLSCKALDEIGKEKYVIRRVGIEELEKSPLFCFNRFNKDAAFAFFQQCIDCNNPEALFQQGTVEYFSQVKVEEGVKSLERATNSGHKMAAYVLGLILLCYGSDTEHKQKGMELVNGVKACKGKRIVEFRRRLKEFLHSIWMKNSYKPISFGKGQHQQHVKCRRRCPWKASLYLLEDDDDAVFCEACTCEYETEFFCSLFSRST